MSRLPAYLRDLVRTHWRAGLIVLVTVASVAGLSVLRQIEEDAHHAADLVSMLRAETYREHAIRLQTVTGSTATEEALGAHDEAQTRIRAVTSELAGYTWSRDMASVLTAAPAYAAVVRDELTLLAAGRHREAALVDEERADPAFEELIGLLDGAHEAASERHHRYHRLVVAASLGILASTIAAVSILVGGLMRSRENGLVALERVAILEEATRRQEEFAAMAAHELRTPLTGIMGSLETLRQAAHDGRLRDSMDEILAIGLSQTRRLRRVCEDLGIAAHPEEADLRLPLTTVPVRATVEAAIRDLGGSAPTRVQVETRDDLWVRADPDRLVQVIANLIRNALQAADDDSPVTVASGVEGDRVAVAVGDHGPGIEPERLESIFDRFGHGSRSGGFGIGLTVVRRLVTAMGGDVAVSSTLGEGSQFVIRLPAASPLAGEPAHGRADRHREAERQDRAATLTA